MIWKTLFCLLLLILVCSWDSEAAELTMCASGCNYTNFASAFAGMSSGDTLTVSPGTYSGTSNRITYNQKPPSGTAGAYTKIRAASPGMVKISASCSWDSINSSLSYVEFENLEFIGGGPDLVGNSSSDRSVHHIKYLSCGTNNQFSFSNSRYILAQDCYSTGNSNYNFITYDSDHQIFRRCIARKDATSGSMPMSHFMSYGSQYVEFQNCIAIDSDSSYYTSSNGSLLGGFYIRKYHDETGNYSTYNSIKGSIVLNVKHKANYEGFVHSVGSGATNFTMSDTVFWDIDNGYVPDNGGVSGATYNHNTFGKSVAHTSWPWNSSFIGGQSGYGIATNNIAVRAGDYAFYSIQSYDYNAFYNNTDGNVNSGTNGGHNVTNVNPETNHLKYLVKVENYSGLDASDSGKMGATILYKVGTDNTLYGDSGYSTITSNKLWPWPNEALIRTFFVEYGSTSPSPARGFCNSATYGTTYPLTLYIANYLGASPAITSSNINTVLYGESSDTIPPSVTISTTDPSNISADTLAISGSASDAVGVTACKWRIGSAPDGSNGTALSGTTLWSGTATGFSSGANTLYAGCTDAAGNWGSDSIVVNYTPPSSFRVGPVGGTLSGGTIQ